MTLRRLRNTTMQFKRIESRLTETVESPGNPAKFRYLPYRL